MVQENRELRKQMEQYTRSMRAMEDELALHEMHQQEAVRRIKLEKE